MRDRDNACWFDAAAARRLVHTASPVLWWRSVFSHRNPRSVGTRLHATGRAESTAFTLKAYQDLRHSHSNLQELLLERPTLHRWRQRPCLSVWGQLRALVRLGRRRVARARVARLRWQIRVAARRPALLATGSAALVLRKRRTSSLHAFNGPKNEKRGLSKQAAAPGTRFRLDRHRFGQHRRCSHCSAKKEGGQGQGEEKAE